MASRPLVTVITATFNVGGDFGRLAATLQEQSFRDFEWIVIDGASTDGTIEVIRANQKSISTWLSEPDTGIYDALNKGVRRASGEWLCFLGGDDWLWERDSLQRMAEVLRTTPPAIRVVYGRVAVVNLSGEILYFMGDEWQRVRERFKSVMSVPHTGLMHHRSLFADHGEFDPSFKIAGDYEFLLRELKTRDARFCPEVIVAGMSCYGLSSNPNSIGLNLHEMRRASRHHGKLAPGTFWMLAMFRHFLRRALWKILGERRARRLLDVGRCILGKPPYWTKV